jgi:hypothetical protein
MSLDPILWALKDAPAKDVEERAVLTIMAEAADEDGCNSYLSQATIAKRSLLADRTVRRRLEAMEDRGLIARGDQEAVARFPADRRPVVWNIQIPYSWFSNIARTNEFRASRNRPPITPQDRPDLGAAPEAKRRVDVGRSRTKGDNDAEETQDGAAEETKDGPTGLQVPPPNHDKPTGLQVRPDSEAPTTGLVVHDDRSGSPTTHVFTHPFNPQTSSPSVENLTVVEGSVLEGGGVDSPKTPTQDEIVEWFARRRPDWEQRRPGAIREALTAAVAQGLGDLATAAAALRELAEGKHGDTGSPRRLLHADGKWWAAVRPRRSPAEVRLAAGPRCGRVGHERQPEVGCALCAGEVNACPECPRGARKCDHVQGLVDREVGERGAAFLPRHLRQREAGRLGAEGVAS